MTLLRKMLITFSLKVKLANNAYKLNNSDINILFKDNITMHLITAADKSTISALSNIIKSISIYPKDFQIEVTLQA